MKGGKLSRLIRLTSNQEKHFNTFLRITPGRIIKCFIHYSIFSFMCVFSRSLFILLSLFFWPLCCLSFFELRILITPLISSNSSFCLQVDIRFSKDRVIPAEDVELEITADPNSLVNVLAVDKSILLIGTGNDITVENVRNYIFHGNKISYNYLLLN